jgi:hypothetical protein
MADKIYAVSKDITYRELKGQILFLLPGDRFLYTMNPAGEFVWKSVLRKRPVDKIVAAFAKHFGIDVERARADVAGFLDQLAAKKIVVKK